MKKLVKEVILNIDRQLMWKALFDNEYVLQYMGCLVRKIGEDKLEWYNDQVVLLKASIVELVMHEYLKLKTFDPNRKYDHECYLYVTYEIKELSNGIKLIMSQYGFEDLPDGEIVYKENTFGWDFMFKRLEEIFS
jgi:hypothetical protein